MAKTALSDSVSGELSKQELLSIYRLMLLIRRFEEPLNRKFREAKIGGYLHLYIGQEAIAAGIIPLLRLPGDYVLSSYRDHGHALACGSDPRSLMAELMGRATGCAGGKGGSMHLIDPDHGFLGGDGIVGGPVPVATGVGYAIKYRGTDNVCVCFVGDGAMNQGGVHEALNMAGLYKLPVLYVVENNQYAMGTPISCSTGQTDLVLKARAHGVQGERIDGMDVLGVRQTAERVIAQMRRTGEPYFIEAICYRFSGHGVADNPTQQRFYRSEAEIEEWKRRDPVLTFRTKLENWGVLSPEEAEAMDAEVRRQIEEAIQFAESSPEPPIDTLFENVFA